MYINKVTSSSPAVEGRGDPLYPRSYMFFSPTPNFQNFSNTPVQMQNESFSSNLNNTQNYANFDQIYQPSNFAYKSNMVNTASPGIQVFQTPSMPQNAYRGPISNNINSPFAKNTPIIPNTYMNQKISTPISGQTSLYTPIQRNNSNLNFENSFKKPSQSMINKNIIAIDKNIVPKLQNIVSTANLGCTLNLRQIALQAKNAEYNPKR